MDRSTFLLTALRDSEVYFRAAWVFSLFTVVRDNNVEKHTQPYPYQIAVQNNQYHYYLNDQWIPITDSPSIDRPLWLVEEAIEIPDQSWLVQPWDGTFPFKTRVGTLFVNYYCLVSCFQDRIGYRNGKLTIKGLESIVTPLIKNREPNVPPDAKAIYPDEVIKFSSACSSMAGFSSIASPSATAYTMQPPPGIVEYRTQLLKQYEGRLLDPAIVAEIDKKLVEYDRAYQKQDPEGGFYQSDKAFNVSRKKLFTMHGLEQPEISGGRKTFIENSLSEGWDINKLPAMINSMRDGSYNRGALTALGGEAVKFIFRIFATTSIVEEDCGTTLGKPVLLTPATAKRYEGNYLILKDGQQVLLDNTNMTKYLQQRVMVRTPGLCRTKHSNFCSKCLGEKMRGGENALAALASEVGSKMLDIFMAKMHGTALITTRWNYETTIT